MLNSKTEFSINGFNRYLSNEISLYADNSRAEPTIISMEKYSYLNCCLSILMDNPSLRLSKVLFNQSGRLCKS